ncbi:MAG TPA: PD-(D/E)XK nuclease family protein, partial [Acidimicrobiales bacterium]
SEWPTLHQFLGRRAFTEQVADALAEIDGQCLSDDEVRRASPAWAVLSGFATRYRAALEVAGNLDFSGLMVRATKLFDDPMVRAQEDGRYAHVLVDDFDDVTAVEARLVAQLAGLGATVTVTGDRPVEIASAPMFQLNLTQQFRHPVAPRLVVCNHPAVEAEAIAGEVLAARAQGLDWSDVAVLVRSAGSRWGAVVRALARHEVPVDSARLDSGHEPVVRAIVDVLRWVDGDPGALDRLLVSPVAALDSSVVRDIRRLAVSDGAGLEDDPRLAHLVSLKNDLTEMVSVATPAELAFEVWTRTLGHLADDAGESERQFSLDQIVAFIDGLQRRAERRPAERLSEFLTVTAGRIAGGGSRAAPSADRHGVTVTSIHSAAGREWHTVIIAGCLEGELPRIRSRVGLFDPLLLRAGGPPGASDRRQLALTAERKVFDSACGRATGQVIGMVAAEPGVLTSRFVESWTPSEPRLVRPNGGATISCLPTSSSTPACSDGHLHLSASQLSLYDDCPLRYAYQYVLGARSEAGVPAALGTLVHEVLAEFLNPDDAEAGDLSHDRLLAIADRRWRDDIAPYGPQVEEVRRDYYSMLNEWWKVEGGDSPIAPHVLAVERTFEIEVGPHTVTGSIDRIDRANDAYGVRVVDYKTGRTKPNLAEVADNIQLAVYHLAATRDPSLVAMGPPKELRLLYLRDLHAYEQEVTPDHATTTEKRILTTADLILAEQFTPSVDADCRTCPFHRLCPLQDEGCQVVAG